MVASCAAALAGWHESRPRRALPRSPLGARAHGRNACSSRARPPSAPPHQLHALVLGAPALPARLQPAAAQLTGGRQTQELPAP